MFREFENKVITEDELIEKVSFYNIEIEKLFFQSINRPVAPHHMHDWSNAHDNVVSSIHDFSLFYNKKYPTTWNSESRKWLMKKSIKQYEDDLETLKSLEKIFKLGKDAD